MKNIILMISVIFIAFTSCKKTYVTDITKTTIDSVKTDSVIVILDSTHSNAVSYSASFPITFKFSDNQIISAPNAIGAETINLDMLDSVAGSEVYIICYINNGASFDLSYNPTNTVVSLTSGSYSSPPQGTCVIYFKFLGCINGVNMISTSVTLQP